MLFIPKRGSFAVCAIQRTIETKVNYLRALKPPVMIPRTRALAFPILGESEKISMYFLNKLFDEHKKYLVSQQIKICFLELPILSSTLTTVFFFSQDLNKWKVNSNKKH